MNRKSLTKILSLLMAILMLSSVMMIPATAATAPKAPTSVTVTKSTSAIKLSWPKVSGASGYRIYYKLPGDLSWRTALKSTASTSHTFKDLPEGQHYTFAVRSYVKSDGEITWGGYKQITTATQTSAPKKLTAEQSTNAIKLTWSKVNSAAGYKIFYKTTASANWKTALSETTKTNHTFKNLPAGKKYIFAVQSYSKSTIGIFYGNYITVETATKPATPTLKATATSSSIALSWSKVNADGYRIYYKTSGSDWKTAVSSTTATGGTFKNLPANKTYTFAVKAYVKTKSGTIWSGYKQVSATTKASSSSSTITGVPSTKSEIAAAYNKAVNDAKSYNGRVVLYQHDMISIEVIDVPSVTQSIIDPVLRNLTQTTPQQWTFENGVDINDPGRRLYDKITPYAREASVNPKGLASASAVANADGGYTMTMKFVAETSVFDGTSNVSEPVYHKGAIDPLELGALDLGPITITSADMLYPGATITATVDAQGRLVKLVQSCPLSGTFSGKAGISLTMNMSGKLDSVYQLKYK